MISAIKNFIKQQKVVIILYCLILFLFFFGFLFANNIAEKINIKLINQGVISLNNGLDQEKQFLLNQVKAVAQSKIVDPYLTKSDTGDLFSLLTKEKDRRGLASLTVTDKDGIVLARTQRAFTGGDYLFYTTTWGHFVARGKDVSAIAASNNFPLVLAGGTPILRDNKVAGGIFSGYHLDNSYAASFQKKYFNNGMQLAFYSDRDGLIGTSFGGAEDNKVLGKYFNQGTDWTSLTYYDEHINLNGHYYFIRPVLFPDLENPAATVGGAIIFIPCWAIGINIIFSVLISLLFLSFVFYWYFKKHRSDYLNHKAVIVIAAIVLSLILFCVMFFFTNHYIAKKYINTNIPGVLIYNSTLNFYPSYGIFDVHYPQTIAIKVNTGGEPINMAEISVDYDPSLIMVSDILTDNSFCDQKLFFKKEIDSQKGEVRIICGLPTPGFSGVNGIVAELVIQPLRTGNLLLSFGADTHILADDGLGTDVLRQVNNSFYQILDYAVQEKTGIPVVIPFSVTHPNREQWYNSRTVRFFWVGQPNSKYDYWLDQEFNSKPVNPKTTTDNMVILNVPDDGIFYFHITAENNSQTSAATSYKLKIDSTPPLPPIIQASALRVKAGTVVRFNFDGEDDTSGLQPNYYVNLGGGVCLPSLPRLYVPFLSVGAHIVTVRIFDQAGNYSDSQITIQVDR